MKNSTLRKLIHSHIPTALPVFYLSVWIQRMSSQAVCTLTGKWTRFGKASGKRLTISKFSHFLNDQLGTSWAECTHTLQVWVSPSPLMISSCIVEGRGWRGVGRGRRGREDGMWEEEEEKGMEVKRHEPHFVTYWITNHTNMNKPFHHIHTDIRRMCKISLQDLCTPTSIHPWYMCTHEHTDAPAQAAVLGGWIK